MSEGCEEPLEKLVFLNARDDLVAIGHLFGNAGRDVSKWSRAQPRRVEESISAFFSPASNPDGDAIVVHSWNSSNHAYINNLLVYLEIHPDFSENKPAMFVVTEAGLMAGSGINSDGLVVTSNTLFSDADFIPGLRDSCFPGACFRRYLLECSNIAEVKNLCELNPRHTSMNVLAADESGQSISLELGPRFVFSHLGRPGSNTVLHTNHFQSFNAFLARREINDRYRGSGSRLKLSQLSHLIAERGRKGITRGSIKDMFSDHEGSPEGYICQHTGETGGNMTVSFVMYNLEQRVITVCKGPPCQGHMMHFTFDDEFDDGVSDTRTGGVSIKIAESTAVASPKNDKQKTDKGSPTPSQSQSQSKSQSQFDRFYTQRVAKKPINPNVLPSIKE